MDAFVNQGLGIALVAAGVLFGGLLLERILLTWPWLPYYRLSFPLGRALLPVPEAPKGEGQTPSVRWAIADAGDRRVVRFWAEPGSRRAPMGLHGLVHMRRMRGQVALDVAWAPPWSPVFAALWLLFLGLFRGDGWVTVPVGSMMVLGIAVLYWRSAMLAARELRWAFVQGLDDDVGPGGDDS
jgi:hypothetical protein